MSSDVFKALGDATRRQILEMLAHEGDKSAGDIASHFAISAPSISHHLSILKNTGLVIDTRHGQSIVYSLNTTVFQQLLQWMYDLFGNAGAPRPEGEDSV